jgi:hypothetical protein
MRIVEWVKFAMEEKRRPFEAQSKQALQGSG